MTTATRIDGGRGLRVAAACLSVAIAAAMVALTAGIALCDTTPAPPRTNLQVTLWDTGVPGEKEALSQLVFSFQRANPDVIVCLEWEDASLAGDLIRRWCNGYRAYAPDVTVMNELWAWEYRHELLHFPDPMAQELRGRFQEAVTARLPGPVRGIPWSVWTPAVYYRTDLLAEAGLEPPTTFAELVECAAALADPPHLYGLGFPGPGGGGEELVNALAFALGGQRGSGGSGGGQDEDGSDESARPDPTEAALALLVELQARGALQPEVLSWGQRELGELFAAGRLGMFIAGPWATQLLRASAEVEWSAMPLPMADAGVGRVSVDWMVAFEDTDRPANALRLMQYLAEEESQRTLALISSAPATPSLLRELRDTAPWSAHIPPLLRGDGPGLSTWPREAARLREALAQVISGRLTPRGALTAGATAAQ
ncbi:MAG: carbohydrate ABC transporter substrate-binding protein [candidate division WS1 bacterium]|nr:carbohydrate ABC transporter substrate-binding protein [candidate division WS1 bacterium]